MLLPSQFARSGASQQLDCFLLALSVLAVVTACGGDGTKSPGETTGPLMRPGQDCLSCHSEGAGRGAPVWSLGGTVYPRANAEADEGVVGVDVLISDANDMLIEKLTTNAVGNFYTATPLAPGFRVALEYQGARIAMPCPPPAGLCNACHNNPPIGQAPGRIYIPQGEPAGHPAFDCSEF